jgi:Domain of unknown function (DUF6457)
MNDWFDALARRFAETAKERGALIAPPELDPQVADEVLELARVAAHSKERRFAPLACFMAGSPWSAFVRRARSLPLKRLHTFEPSAKASRRNPE